MHLFSPLLCINLYVLTCIFLQITPVRPRINLGTCYMEGAASKKVRGHSDPNKKRLMSLS